MVLMAILGPCTSNLNAALIKQTFKTSNGPAATANLSSVKYQDAKREIANRKPIPSVCLKCCRRSSIKSLVYDQAESRLFKHLDVVEILKKQVMMETLLKMKLGKLERYFL